MSTIVIDPDIAAELELFGVGTDTTDALNDAGLFFPNAIGGGCFFCGLEPNNLGPGPDYVAQAGGNDITTEELKEIFPNASDEELEETRDAFNEAYDKFDIDTPLRKAHFFAQLREEVGGGITLTESLNYSATALPTQFSVYRATDKNGNTITPYVPNDLANQHGRSAQNNWTADQDAIADNAYANRMGNGNVESGDGSQYKGQGFIHLTGRDNYETVNDEIQDKFPDSGLDIVDNEEDIKTTRGSMISAMAYWSENNINTVADQGSEGSNADAVTDIVNSGTNSKPARRTHLETTVDVFNVE